MSVIQELGKKSRRNRKIASACTHEKVLVSNEVGQDLPVNKTRRQANKTAGFMLLKFFRPFFLHEQ